MTLYLEPLAIETESRNMAGQEGTLQYFHIKTIKSDVELYGLLARKYGNKFEVEMRHNVYRIKTPHGSAALSLVSNLPIAEMRGYSDLSLKMEAETPQVQLNSDPPFTRVPTGLTIAPTTTPTTAAPADSWPDDPQLPDISALDKKTTYARAMQQRLQANRITYPNSSSRWFWPRKLFDHLFDGEIFNLVGELIEAGILSPGDRAPEDARKHWTNVVRGTGLGRSDTGYRHLFALLLLVGKGNHVVDFINAQVNDTSLPFDKGQQPFKGILEAVFAEEVMDIPLLDLVCGQYQWQLTVPCFDLIEERVCQIELDEQSYRPWYQIRGSQVSTAASVEQTRGGAYGHVCQIKIHPWQHSFNPVLKSTLNEGTAEDLFYKEADMLTKFGREGTQNVRLLAKIIERVDGRERYSLLFPWAEWDLKQYWESNAKRKPDLLWIAKQFYGLADALTYIHEPPDLRNQSGERLFGRHGDIKPDNILWFQNDEGNMLAFSDMGLTRVHRDATKSNIPGQGIPATPLYRPPECEMAGREGYISRSFDIWTLGCVFLEFVVWILKGYDGLTEFKEKRWTPYIHAREDTNIFFSLMRDKGSKTEFIFQVQDSCFDDLHEDEHCTKYLHELLDVVQGEMLIVESKDPLDGKTVRRMTAKDLRTEMKKLLDKCLAEDTYYQLPCKGKSTAVALPPVRAELNQKALETAGQGNLIGKLRIYEGETRATSWQNKPANV
ncbi:hypothetical protein OQA88_2716 [Cercophora sp. LCS_1]